MTMEQPKSGPTEAMSEKVSVTVSDPPKKEKNEGMKICPECDITSLIKVDDRHWTCTNCKCKKTFLIQEVF